MGKLTIGPKHLLKKAQQAVAFEANTVFKTVEVPIEKIVQVAKEVPIYIDREVIKYVEVPVEKVVERIVEIVKEVPIEKIVTVVQTVEKPVEVTKEVVNYVDRLIIKQKIPGFIVGVLWVETALLIALLISKLV